MSEIPTNYQQNPAAWESEDNENSLQLADIWGMIWNNIWWYVLSILLCLCLVSFYLYRTPKTFSRSAKVIVSEDAQNAALRNLAAFSDGMAASRARGSGTNVYNEIQAFTSPDLMESVVRRLGYEATYTEVQLFRKRERFSDTPFVMAPAGDNPPTSFSFTVTRQEGGSFRLSDFVAAGQKIKTEETVPGFFGDTLSTPVGRIVLFPTQYLERWDKDMIVSWVNAMGRAKSFGGRLSVSLSDKMSTVLVLSLTDLFPARASNILNTLIDIYNENWIENKNRSARNTSEFINERLVIIENELGGVESDLKAYKEQHGITDIASVSHAYMSESSDYAKRYFDVNNELSMARYIKDYLNDPMHSDALIPAGTGISGSVESQIQSYNKLKLDRDRLLGESSSANPIVSDMNESLEALKNAVLRSVDNLIATLQLQADKIQNEENKIMGRISNISGQELQLLSIERQQKVKESLYIYLLQKREENEIASLVNVGNTRLIMSPNGSGQPVSPNTKMLLLVALILGAGIPFAFFFLKDQLDTRIKGRGDIAHLQAPFLGEIPQMGLQGLKWWERIRIDRYNTHNSQIIVKHGKRDMMNEAFRVVRTNLDLMAGNKRVMIASFNPNAGKTFIDMNLAAAMALKGAKVLLIDLDLRKATLSNALGAEGDKGVSAYLNGRISLEEAIHPVQEHLDLMPVGNLPPNPTELLLNERFSQMLDLLSEKYDYLFMDCPPVDIVADTAIVAKHADITLFVLRANLFDKRALPAVKELYQSGRFPRMAIILNGVEVYAGGRNYGYSYGHRYGYGYGYGFDASEDK